MELLFPIVIAVVVLILSGFRIYNNTTTVILMPSEFTNAAKSFSEMVSKKQKADD